MKLIKPSVAEYVDQLHAFKAELPGTSLKWLCDQRERALAQFKSSGFPSPREEEWKYTNVAPIERKLFTPSTKGEQRIDEAWLKPYRLAGSHQLVFVNGFFAADFSSVSDLPEGSLVTHIVDALERYPDLVEKYFGQCLEREHHGFIHFNSAYFTDGCFIHIPENTHLKNPIQLIYVNSAQDALATTRNLIVADQGAKAEFIETYTGLEHTGYLNASVTEVSVGEKAQIDWYKLQCEAPMAYHFGGTYVDQKSEGIFRHHGFSFGGLLVRNEIHSTLGQAADCSLNGLYLGSQKQHSDNHTRIYHAEPLAISREMYKGIMDDESKGVFQGRVVVHKDAQETDSQMNNRNLLLSENAEIDTKPQLEIYADDVKCAHGVTVGQLDEELVFYLQSRCVDDATARNLLTFAFANEMVEKIEIDELRGLVQESLLEKFPQTGIPKEWL